MVVASQRAALVLLCVCFFLSGATGLVYEVVWLRMLGLVFGHTVYAITTVLAAFMAGLALGSFLFARRATRIRKPILVYGLLEIGIGLYCALLPAMLWLVSSAYPHLYRLLSVSYAAFGFLQFLLVATVLIVPTMLMGATLPILAQHVVQLVRDRPVGRTVGMLYAINTFGAVLGVAAAGYLLLPAVGNRAALAVAAIANVAVGALAVCYSMTLRAPAVTPNTASRSPRPSPARPHTLTEWRLVALALGVSGAMSMVYEVAWSRALILIIGSSTYAFSAMLVSFLVGIAGGATLYSWLWGSRTVTAVTFAAIQAGIGLTNALVLLAFDRFPEIFLSMVGSMSIQRVELVQLVVSTVSLLAPTLFIGASFPCAVAVCAPRPESAGHATGRLYAATTTGAIAGTVLTGFVLIPTIGVHSSIKLAIITNLVLALTLSIVGSRPIMVWRWVAIPAALGIAGAVLFLPPWDLKPMSSGPAIHALRYLKEARANSLGSVLRATGVLFYRDGLSATVSVNRSGEHLVLRVNGKPDASTDPLDMQAQLMLGHLPLVVHRDPASVLIVGLGSGITAGAVARHPIRHMEVVEIEPAVVTASSFFTRENRDVLKDPRLRLVMADARNYLFTTPELYDVIISEPSNPWIGNVASLYTLESFRLARSRLRPGGVMAQWVQSYSLLPEDFKMIVSTFRTVFPAMTIWNVSQVDYVLIGTTEPVPVDLGRLKAIYQSSEGLRRDFAQSGIIDWPGLLGYYMLGGTDVSRFVGDAPLNTDDRLRLEFSAPRALYLETSRANFRLMRSFRTADLPELSPEGLRAIDEPRARTVIGATGLWRKTLDDALDQFRRALELDPDYTPAIVGTAEVLLRQGNAKGGLGLAEKVIAREPLNVNALYLAGLASTALDDRIKGIAYLEQASALAPHNEEMKRSLREARRGPQVKVTRPGTSTQRY